MQILHSALVSNVNSFQKPNFGAETKKRYEFARTPIASYSVSKRGFEPAADAVQRAVRHERRAREQAQDQIIAEPVEVAWRVEAPRAPRHPLIQNRIPNSRVGCEKLSCVTFRPARRVVSFPAPCGPPPRRAHARPRELACPPRAPFALPARVRRAPPGGRLAPAARPAARARALRR